MVLVTVLTDEFITKPVSEPCYASNLLQRYGNNHIQIRCVLSSLSKKKVKIMGHLRQLVLNIVRFNRTTKECLVVSMYGEQSDWYQNIQAHPAAPS